MMPANCNQIPVSSDPIPMKESFDKTPKMRNKKSLTDDGSDHSHSKKTKSKSSGQPNPAQPTAAIPFPWKLHRILNDADAKGFNDIISWVPAENGFKVHKTKQFDDEIMPKYFDKTKYKSFQRQLNMWGFDRVGSGPYKGAYLHDCFRRGHEHLCESMKRTKIKGIHSKKLRKNSMLSSNSLDGGSNHSLGSRSSLGGSTHSLGGSARSSHSLGGGSNHSLGGSSHHVRDVQASIKAASQKVAELERQKELLQRKLDMVSTKANAAAATSSSRIITPHGSLHSSLHSREEPLEDDFQPLPLNEGDSLFFGGRNFFFVDDRNKSTDQSPQPRRRTGRRFSLTPKSSDSDEYVLKEMPEFFGDDMGSGSNQNSALNRINMAEEIMSPTPLPPNLDVIRATTDMPNNHNSSLVIGLDGPSRRFSLLGTPVQNPFDKPYQTKQRPPRMSMEGMNRAMMKTQMMKLDMMKNQMMNMNNMNGNNQQNMSYMNMDVNSMTNNLSNMLKVSSHNSFHN